MTGDPASLSNLNDIMLASAPGWWPLAPGWYVLGLVLAGWRLYRYWQRYQCNRYRRAAMAELREIVRSNDPKAIRALPALLKRTAMQAYSREQVAGLSQENWQQYLDRHCKGEPFRGRSGALLSELAYQPDTFDPADRQALIASARTWISQHRAEPC